MADGLSAAQQKRLNPDVELRADGSKVALSNGQDVVIPPEFVQQIQTGLGTSATITGITNQFHSNLNRIEEPSENTSRSAIDPGEQSATKNTSTSVDPENIVRPNPLNKFVNYTYNIKFGIMTPAMLNEFHEGNYSAINQNLLMASGGTSISERAQYFNADFYIEDLDIETFIGLNQLTGGANATTLDFTIIEPAGISFFNRLLALCNELKIPNYMDVPYFLNIQFYGYDDVEDQNEQIAYDRPFIIPIKLTEIRHNVSQKGGEYNVSAVSFDDSALLSNEITLQESFESRASTVGEFLDQLEASYNKFYESALKEQQQSNAELPFNEDFYHTIKFEVPDEIRNSSLRFKKDVKTIETAPATSSKSPITGIQMAVVSQNGKSPTFVDEYLIKYLQGANIVDMINKVIINKSDYVKKQKINPEEIKNINKEKDPETRDSKLAEFAEKIDKPLKWFKIRTEKKIKQYNSTLKQYARDNTIIIEDYEVSNTSVASYPGWGEAKPIKEYNYIYTGKNDVVLDFDIKFDVLYYQTLLPNADKTRIGSGDTDKTGEGKTQSDLTNAQGNEQSSNSINPAQKAAKGLSIKDNQGIDPGDYEQVADSILKNNIYANSAGDMINVNLSIIGDPEFLLGYNFNDFSDDETAENVNLLRLQKEINCYLNYRTPQDYDEETGMLLQSTDPAFFNNAVSGIYKIISVTNRFNRGQFTQNLDTIRLKNQPGTYTNSGDKTKQSDSANDSITGAGGLDQVGTDNALQGFRSGFGNQLGGLQKSLADSAAAAGEIVPSQQNLITQLGATISPDTASGFNPTVNVARSNGSSVFAGLAADNDAQPVQVSTQPGQTSLTKAQERAIQTGSFKTGFNQ
jgi:hypothetical protein